MDAGLLGAKDDLFNVPGNSVIAFVRFDSMMSSMNFSCSGLTLYLLAFFTLIEPPFYSSSLLIKEFSLEIIDMSPA
jgi:uncharacterized membrane protein